MVRIQGIEKSTLVAATRSALAELSAGPVPLHVVRRFIASQFKLRNEHQIESMFNERKPGEQHNAEPFHHANPSAPHQVAPAMMSALGQVYVVANGAKVFQWRTGYEPAWVDPAQVTWDGLWVGRTRECAQNIVREHGCGEAIQLSALPELMEIMAHALEYSLFAMPDVERKKSTVTYTMGVSEKQRQIDAPMLSPAMYMAQCFRILFHRCFVSAQYPPSADRVGAPVLYIPDMDYSVDVAGISVGQRIAMWAVWQIGGRASHAMMAHMTQLPNESGHYPRPDDLSSWVLCVVLLHCFPEWRARLPEMAGYPGWGVYISHWQAWENILLEHVSLPRLLSGDEEIPVLLKLEWSAVTAA